MNPVDPESGVLSVGLDQPPLLGPAVQLSQRERVFRVRLDQMVKGGLARVLVDPRALA